jgi:hypothetical protein
MIPDMTSSISLRTTLAAVKDQVSADLTGEVIILNMRNGQYFGLSEVGARIWALLQERRTVQEVRDRLLEAYPGVEPDRCTEDLLDLVAQLAEAELVEIE